MLNYFRSQKGLVCLVWTRLQFHGRIIWHLFFITLYVVDVEVGLFLLNNHSVT